MSQSEVSALLFIGALMIFAGGLGFGFGLFVASLDNKDSKKCQK